VRRNKPGLDAHAEDRRNEREMLATIWMHAGMPHIGHCAADIWGYCYVGSSYGCNCVHGGGGGASCTGATKCVRRGTQREEEGRENSQMYEPIPRVA
jgi:hypothetical protein